LRPIESIRRLRCPVLILAGTADHNTTEAQTRALFAAANNPKELGSFPAHRTMTCCDSMPEAMPLTSSAFWIGT
jgi:pimeloyl-ACP methyl ester carboxylesterase